MLKTLQPTSQKQLSENYELKVAAGGSREEDDTMECYREEEPTLTIPQYNPATAIDEIKEQNEKPERKDAYTAEDGSGDHFDVYLYMPNTLEIELPLSYLIPFENTIVCFS